MKNTLGFLGEKIALRYLQKKGYDIIHTNWYCRWGEIDIVSKREDKLCFFEVKTRQTHIEESLDYFKQKRLLRTIKIYVMKYGHSFENIQVDFLGIELGGIKPRIVHYENVLEARI